MVSSYQVRLFHSCSLLEYLPEHFQQLTGIYLTIKLISHHFQPLEVLLTIISLVFLDGMAALLSLQNDQISIGHRGDLIAHSVSKQRMISQNEVQICISRILVHKMHFQERLMFFLEPSILSLEVSISRIPTSQHSLLRSLYYLELLLISMLLSDPSQGR